MIPSLFVFLLLSISTVGDSVSSRPTQSASPEPCAQDHEAWLGHALEKMVAIKPGMTRSDLLKVFKMEGGLSTALRGTFVSQDCPYCKIDVEFKAARQSDHNNPALEDSRDTIVKVSRPYLQFAIAD